MQGHAGRPETPALPAAQNGKRLQTAHLRKRIESDADHERADPAKDLRLPVRLKPGRRERVQRAVTADGDQIPDPQKRAKQNQKGEPGTDECSHEPLQGFFPQHGLLRLRGEACILRSPLLLSGASFELKSSREQNVVFKMNVQVRIPFEISKAAISRLIAQAGILGWLVIVAR